MVVGVPECLLWPSGDVLAAYGMALLLHGLASSLYGLTSVFDDVVSLLGNLRVNLVNLGESLKEKASAGGERRTNADAELLDAHSVKQLAWKWTRDRMLLGSLVDKLFLSSLVNLLVLPKMYKHSCWSSSTHRGGSSRLPTATRTSSSRCSVLSQSAAPTSCRCRHSSACRPSSCATL